MQRYQSYERSAGAILATLQEGVRYYVLVEECVNGSLGLPKGHIESGETAERAALREVWEEAGVHARIVQGAPVQVIEYDLPGGIHKSVTYFIAVFDRQVPHPHPGEAGGLSVGTLDMIADMRLNHATTLTMIQRADRFFDEHPEAFG